jgi:hypothetical protein
MNSDPANVKHALRKVRLFFGAMAAVLVGGIAASFFAGRAAVDAMDRLTQFDAVMDSIRDTISQIDSQQEDGRADAKQAADSAIRLQASSFSAP